MFYPTKAITFEEIIDILERSWDKMSLEQTENEVRRKICRIEISISFDYSPENHYISIITPHRTLTFHTWCGSPCILEDNGKQSKYEQWDTWFFETIRKITMFIYEKSRNLFRPFISYLHLFNYPLTRNHIGRCTHCAVIFFLGLPYCLKGRGNLLV